MEKKLLDLLDIMFDAYENGPDCYEDPEECDVYVGKAIKLDDATFHRIADILNEHRLKCAEKGRPILWSKKANRPLCTR